MTGLRHVAAPEGVAAGRGYSHVVTGRGRLVVVSGQVAQNDRGELVGPGDPAAQARQITSCAMCQQHLDEIPDYRSL